MLSDNTNELNQSRSQSMAQESKVEVPSKVVVAQPVKFTLWPRSLLIESARLSLIQRSSVEMQPQAQCSPEKEPLSLRGGIVGKTFCCGL